jgi:hypothetical protein
LIRTPLEARMPHSHRAPRPFTVARVLDGRSVAVRQAPGGRVLGHAGPRTEFGSPTRLSVAERRGRWLGVESPALPNGRLAWIDERSPALVRARTRVSLRVDLSQRRATLLDGTRAVRRMRVDVGAPASPTPTGRFAVTDKLAGSRFSSSYGCCIVALSGRQPRPPATWRGGNRLAIHGTGAPGNVGGGVSAGCLHAADADLRVLMRRVPLGTPVFIRE